LRALQLAQQMLQAVILRLQVIALCQAASRSARASKAPSPPTSPCSNPSNSNS
jgi:hypothetical protein